MEIRLTKFVHACLLIESEIGTVLLDPGKMTRDSGLLKAAGLKRLDAIAITHEHFDHFSPELVQDLCRQFPEAPVVSTTAVRQALTAMGIHAGNTSPLVEAVGLPHESMEPLSGGITAENILVI